MSVHLNECQCYEGSCCPWMGYCTCQCICDVLRACEKRIKTHEGCADAERIEGYVDGYADALDAALHALYSMENMGGYPEFDFDHIRDDFRDVIDSLKEKP